MTIWLLALLLLASLAGLGYRQGAIRVAFSLIGIIFGALLCVPLGRIIKPILTIVGMKNPVLVWALAPLIMFIIISMAFKGLAAWAHHKADVFYKYKAGDLRLALWERLNHRVGLCLGLVNGTLYLILIAFMIYSFSYWTYQVATPDNDSKSLSLLNRMGKDLERTGFNRVAAAVDAKSSDYYDAADLAGVLYRNPLTEARLQRYPGFLSLAERPEFLDLTSDPEFTRMRQAQEPIATVLNYQKVQAIAGNPDTLKAIWSTIIPDVKDLQKFLREGISDKYGSTPILGRWDFSVNSGINMIRRAKPNLPSTEMAKLKRGIALAFAKTSLVLMPDHTAILKGAPRSLKLAAASLVVAPPTDLQTLSGKWNDADGKYELRLPFAGSEVGVPVAVEGDRLTIKSDEWGMIFEREE